MIAAATDPLLDDALAMRRAGPARLAAALEQGRAALLDIAAAWHAQLGPAMRVPRSPELNLPLWELGHIGWFESWWLDRHPQRALGLACDPDAPRAPAFAAGDDAMFDSSRIAHAERWQVDLPDRATTLARLAEGRARTLRLLADTPDDDVACYLPRLVLFHEDMHREAWLCMSQTLGLDPGPAAHAAGADAELRAPAAAGSAAADDTWAVPAGRHRLGTEEPGFAFDNELAAHDVALDAFRIDRRAVTWARFLPFVEAGGYADPRWWSPEGWRWRTAGDLRGPRHLLRRADGGWDRIRFDRTEPLPPDAPAVHLSGHEARAWCAWAGRRLPTEAEWERAAVQAAASGERFAWGEVWEWTASPFAPFAGFQAHPYRDYSRPWFDGRPVLRGASFATAPRMRHARYRNFFPAERNDVFAGFRSCTA